MTALRHLVFFEFRSDLGDTDIQEICKTFDALPGQIPEILGYETGTNNSPEGLAGGFTRCFQLTFASEADRNAYLVHPAHKAFQQIADPCIRRVLVFDYWAEPNSSG